MNLLGKPVPLQKNNPPKNSRPNSESRQSSLVKIIRWQGRAIVLLAVALALVSVLKVEGIKLPSQEAVLTPPPITESNLQYNVFAYQNAKIVTHGQTINNPNLEIIGQVYEYKEAKLRWPDLIFVLNGASVPLNDTGNYLVDLSLKPGPNIVETSLQLNGKDYNRQQIVITYTPTQTVTRP